MKEFSRRSFCKKTTTAAIGTMFLPNLFSRSVNNKLNIAVIGVGGQGMVNIAKALRTTPENQDNIVALCDVDDTRAARTYEAYPDAKRFKDFRVMFDKMGKEIDAVMVCTPDHTHFPALMAAMQLGKHVACEKPLAHNIWQLRTLQKASHYYKVITQTCNQGHATNGIRLVKEWYEAGLLGNVTEVLAWFDGPVFSHRGYFIKPDSYPPKEMPIPETLDWDAWVGPAQYRPYNSCYLPKYWRGWYDFGNGEMGDWSNHTLDAPFWSLDLGMPDVAESEFRSETPEGFVNESSILRVDFPKRGSKPPVTLKWYEGGLKPEMRPEFNIEMFPGNGMIMVGDKISLMTGGRPNNPKLLLPTEEWEEFQKNPPAKTIPRVEEENPQREWIDAIKGVGEMPCSNFDYSTRLNEMALVAVLAQKTNSRIEYDAKNMKVTNHPEFDKYIKEPVRDGWKYGEEVWKK